VTVLPRFFAPAMEIGGRPFTLPAEEARHLTRVLRLGAGARVLAFDGRGTEVVAEVREASKASVVLVAIEPSAAAPEQQIRIVLAQSVLKGDRMDAVVRDATMLGVAEIQPVVAHRTVVPFAAARHRRVHDRWSRVVLASAKQCGRAVVPTIAPALDLSDALARSSETRSGLDSQLLLFLVEPSALAEATPDRLPAERPDSVVLFVGPEGGWAPEEIASAAVRGVRLWSLGGLTLRADAVAVVALGILSYLWGGHASHGT
jgi:16S rRNA (uracil1498-N3)-methyltransferase